MLSPHHYYPPEVRLKLLAKSSYATSQYLVVELTVWQANTTFYPGGRRELVARIDSLRAFSDLSVNANSFNLFRSFAVLRLESSMRPGTVLSHYRRLARFWTDMLTDPPRIITCQLSPANKGGQPCAKTAGDCLPMVPIRLLLPGFGPL